MVANTGAERPVSDNRLLGTLGYGIEGGSSAYALEGAIFNAGTVIQWLRDDLGLIADAPAEDGWGPGANIVVDGFDCDTDEIELRGVTANVGAGSTTDEIIVSISGNAQDDADDGQGSLFPLESGSTIDLGFDASNSGGIFNDGSTPSVDIVLTFSNPCTEDCVISFTFNCGGG